MRVQALIPALSIGGAHAARILQSNDDGWAESYIRTLNNALVSAGHDVVLSAPAENKSGSSSLDIEPSPRKAACEYSSCAANSGPVGSDPSNPRLNWVNSYPVTSARYGLETFGPQFWGDAKPDLVVSGPNVGSNLFLEVPFSGTVGVAVYASHEAGIPALAFSGATEDRGSYAATPVPASSTLYAALATQLTAAVLAAGAPYLPADTYLNVNFPEVAGACTDPAAFKWVLTRVNPGLFSDSDVETCGTDRLPTESDVVGGGGCFIAVSVGDSTDKTTAPAAKQAVVLQKLGSMFTCWSG
ncbi:sure-like protein [Xylariaceae sp. FL1651]|nr:sure-like protein [Xylariaceae sp. FL1651]